VARKALVFVPQHAVSASDRQISSHPDDDAVARLSASLERAEPGVVKGQTLIVLRKCCGSSRLRNEAAGENPCILGRKALAAKFLAWSLGLSGFLYSGVDESGGSI
jgi:hypothetical protein